ncbi:MAG: hypothetical protein EB101_11550, partial [Chitinophagia bacterium]|nr:hypothetical protein [Chitinophagia bacterium]
MTAGHKLNRQITVNLSLGLLVFFVTASAQNVLAQATVYNRNDTSIANWWDGGNPWWYGSAPAQNRPDNSWGGQTRHNVIYDHNNNTSSSVNGAFFGLRSLTFASTASSARTFTGSGSGAGISLTDGLTNNSAATMTFNVDIGIDGSSVTFNAGSGQLVFNWSIFGNANSMTFSGNNNINVAAVVSGAGGGTITKSGSGVLTFGNAANSHDKVISITGGKVSISASRHLGGDPTGFYGGKISLNGGTLLTTASFGLNSNYGTTLGANHGTVEVASGTTLDFNPVITGSGNFTKTGAGTVIFVANNTYTGSTTITEGTVRLNGNNRIADTSSINLGGGTLQASGTVSDSMGALNVTSTGTIDLGSGTAT